MIRSAPFGSLTTAELYGILRLRSHVFVVEQECVFLDMDGLDSAATHYWSEEEGEVVACARLVAGDPCVLGRIVTAPAWRGRRLAGALIDAALADVPAGATVTMHAQSRLEPWYGQWGFVRTGPDFLEDGMPHVPMALHR